MPGRCLNFYSVRFFCSKPDPMKEFIDTVTGLLCDLWVEEPAPTLLTVFFSPVIAARPFTVPYLTALLPSELEMQQMEETDSSEQDDQTDTENLPLHMSTVRPTFRDRGLSGPTFVNIWNFVLCLSSLQLGRVGGKMVKWVVFYRM